MLDASSSENASLANRSPSVPLATDSTPPRHEVAPDRDTREPSSRFRYEQPTGDQPSVSRRIAHPVSIPAIGDNDLRALTFLFDRYEMSEVEADIDRALSRLTPEPCWEDADLEFVHHD